MIKAILFDMDGVIINSEPIHSKVESSLLVELGAKVTEDDFLKYAGMPFDAIAADVLKKDKDDPVIKDVVKKKFDRMLPLCEKELKTYPNVTETLKQLKKEFSLALASSSISVFIKYVIKKFNLSDNFDVVVSAADDVKNGKPAPDIFLKAAEKLNVKPEECVVVEDALNGIKAAKAAGMKCIANTNSFPKDKLTEADLIIDNFNELTIDTIKQLGEK